MVLRSKYLVDSSGKISKDVEVKVEGGRIESIRTGVAESLESAGDVIDLGSAILLPGLVNAHAHLELTTAQKHVKPHSRFTDWIREVVATTREWTAADFDSSLRNGIELSIAAGTTTIGDISGMVRAEGAYIEGGMRVRLFHEIIGFDPDVAGQIIESLKQRISEHEPAEKLLIGISPHTPYTVSERLLKECAALAHARDVPLCIHLAESMAELEFLLNGVGEILEFRNEFGLPPSWKPPRTSPVKYLQRLGFFEKPVTLIHCNYVEDEDFRIITDSGSSVVFCPRSHAYFGHTAHPFLRMQEQGINVALGTDSLISSPSLNVLDEMIFLRKKIPGLNPFSLLAMATENGLRAVGLAPDAPLLRPGSAADIAGVALPEDHENRFETPLDAILSKRPEIIFSMAGGTLLLDSRRKKG